MAPSVSQGKRITLKRRRPNPIFEEWLEELYEEAREKKSKLESMLKVALESISKYPLPLKTGADCAVLNGFDKKLCIFLDRRLEVFKSQPDDPKPSTPSFQEQTLSQSQSVKLNEGSQHSDPPDTSNRNQSTSSPNKNVATENALHSSSDCGKLINKVSKSRKRYKPVFRSGSYAILVALLEQLRDNPEKPTLNKEKLIAKAQQFSEESFTRPKPESFYTAWCNMTRLVSKGLVKQTRSKKTDYSLTDEGAALAIELLEDAKSTPIVNDMIFKGASTSCAEVTNNGHIYSQPSLPGSSKSTQSSQELVSSLSGSQRTTSGDIFIEMSSGTFDVILLIDKNETSGVSNKKDPTVVQFNKYPDLKHEYRSLKVGDFTWIARHQVDKNQELVLPYIVERKRMDDLGASIKDGRFHEQKFRLRKCGLPNVIYLIENFGSNKHVGLPFQSLMQALANTRVQDDFKVHITDSLTNTARFLAMMTKRLTIEYKDKSLIGSNSEAQGDILMIFNYFNKSSTKSKPLTVTETFIKLLLQLRGVSVEKALAITRVYKTPKSLIKGYENCNQKEGEMLLASLKYSEQHRNIGPAVSKAIYKFLTWKS